MGSVWIKNLTRKDITMPESDLIRSVLWVRPQNKYYGLGMFAWRCFKKEDLDMDKIKRMEEDGVITYMFVSSEVTTIRDKKVKVIDKFELMIFD